MQVVVITQGRYASGAEMITKELYLNKKSNVVLLTGSQPIYAFFKKNKFTTRIVKGLRPLDLKKMGIRKYINIIKTFWEIRKNIKKFNPNYIHVNNIQSLFYAYISTLGLRIPILLQVHDYYSKSKIIKVVAKLLRNKPKYIIAVSDDVRKDLLEIGFSKSRVRTVHNGISFEKNCAYQSNSNPIITVGFVATISEWKGLHVLLKAADIIQKKGYSLRYAIVGPFVDKNYQKRIKRMADNFPKRSVKFYGKCDDARKLMSGFDILVHCSVNPDPFPTVILEGFFSKCAVIGSDSGGVPEMISDGKTGLLHKMGSPESLANAIEKLVTNKKLRKQVAIQGYETAVKCFSLQRFQTNFFNYLESKM